MCCRLQFCIGGFELKCGVWTLAMLEIILGSFYLIAEASGSLKNVEWIKQWLHIYIYVVGALSLIGGLLLIIGIKIKSRVLLIAGAVLGYPIAIQSFMVLRVYYELLYVLMIYNQIGLYFKEVLQIYLTIVLCSFLDQIG